MPTYEYRCPKGHDFERFYRKISDAATEVACPDCGVVAERRMSAGAGLLFKGSGFYLTDYGKNAHRTSGSAPQPSEGGKDGAKEGGSSKDGASSKEGGSSNEGGSSKEGGSASGSGSSDSGSRTAPAASTESKPATAPKTESKPASTGSTPKSDK